MIKTLPSLLTALCCTLALPAVAQQRLAAPAAAPASNPAQSFAEAAITPAELRRHLTELASDAYEGRETGQPGQKKAAAYLTSQFEVLGLRGPVTGSASPYQQPFGVVRYVPGSGGWLRTGAATFRAGHDFVCLGPSAFRTETAAEPVFLGFGIETERYNDYAAQPDVRGRDVLLLQGEPVDPRGRYLLSGSKQATEWSSVFRKAALARDKGARSVIVVSFAGSRTFAPLAASMSAQLTEPAYELLDRVAQPAAGFMLTEVPPPGITLLFASADMGARLLGTTYAGLTGYLQASFRQQRPPAAAFQLASFSVQLPQERQELAAENVLGFLEGTDRKDEVLVVSAHYDHVGVQHDTIYNGADDDGSGTSAVLALARAFSEAKAAGQGPRRSMLFLLNAGEEKGLLGSEYYTGHPIFPLQNTVADLNIDMVGRTDKKHTGKASGYLYLIGSDRLSSELHALSEATNQRTARLQLDYHYNAPNDPEQLYYRSDHYNFARHRIPVIFYTSGLHADYHKATDDVEKIEFDNLTQRARLIFYTAWELANREQRPVVDK